MEAGKDKPFNKKPTTSSQRLAIRLEASRQVKNPASKSARIFLRKKIMELREAKLAESRNKNLMTNQSVDQGAAGSIEPKHKVYGGYAKDDNPQTQEKKFRFELSASNAKLRKEEDSTLVIMLSEIYRGDSSALFRKSIDPDRLNDIGRFLEGLKARPLSFSKRNKIIRIILDANRKSHTGINGSDTADHVAQRKQ
jgi:hypothetical protein